MLVSADVAAYKLAPRDNGLDLGCRMVRPRDSRDQAPGNWHKAAKHIADGILHSK